MLDNRGLTATQAIPLGRQDTENKIIGERQHERIGARILEADVDFRVMIASKSQTKAGICGDSAAYLRSDLLRLSLSASSPRGRRVKFLAVLHPSPWGRLPRQFCCRRGSQAFIVRDIESPSPLLGHV